MADDARPIDSQSGPASHGAAGHWERRFSVNEFCQMAEAGLFDDAARYELWDGKVMMSPPPNDAHGNTDSRLSARLVLGLSGLGLLENRFLVRANTGLQLSEALLLAPDTLVLKAVGPAVEGYRSAADVVFCAETATWSLKRDLTDKRLKYAASEIPEYWVLDALGAVVHVFREPSRGDYLSHTEHRAGESVCPLFEPRVSIAVSELF